MSSRDLALLIGGVLLSACARAPHSDRLFVGGMVHTDNGPESLAIAVAEGRIVALVSPDDLAPWRRAAAEVIDLAGAHVYPGFTESHGHFIAYGASLEQVELHGATSYREVVERVRTAAASLPPGTWVRGRGWDQNLWPEKSFPTHHALSAATLDHPVVLRRVDGHAVLTNARGLAVAGIDRATQDPAGGRIIRDVRGEPTGVLVDGATGLLERMLPPSTDAELERQVALAGRHLTAFGFTEIHTAGCSRAELAVLRRLQAAGRLPLRVYAMLDDND
jgi:predicted amidohydrolase YtcJ